MKMVLPFDEKGVVENFGGRQVRFYYYVTDRMTLRPDIKGEFLDSHQIVFDDGGDASWYIENGHLVVDQGSRGSFVFDGYSCRCGEVFVSGEAGIMALQKDRDAKFGVLISTNQKYRDKTLPIVVASVRKAGFKDEDIRIVSSGCNMKECAVDDEFDGIAVDRIMGSYKGSAGLGGADDTCTHWLLIHDTCELEPGILEKLRDLDLSLNPDFIPFMGDMGVFSYAAADRIRDEMLSAKFLGSGTGAYLDLVVIDGGGELKDQRVRVEPYQGCHSRKKFTNRVGVVKYRNFNRAVGL